jgi:hypothetical protein
LLAYARTAEASKPSEKWLQRAGSHLAAVGEETFKRQAVRWFRVISQPSDVPLSQWNTSFVKGLVWCCSLVEDEKVCRSLAALGETCFRKIVGAGLHSERVGNACIFALGAMPGNEPVAQLARLRIRVKHRPAQKAIRKALDAAAGRAGLSTEELEELFVPTYGLDEHGRLRETIGRFTAEVSVACGQSTEWRWRSQEGRIQKSVPAEVRKDHAEDLKALKQPVQEIEKMLPAQRDRIEALLRTERSWALLAWRERYLDHPLLAGLTRRLICCFQQGKRTALGIWYDGQIVDEADRPVDWLIDQTRVRLWHPIGFAPETVLQWRTWLEEHEVTQPFKQAHREVYILTDAELNTRTYSNRFAAHILKQHQLNALCQQKGWKYHLQGAWDNLYDSVATLALPL